jgi:hypothetical protein
MSSEPDLSTKPDVPARQVRVAGALSDATAITQVDLERNRIWIEACRSALDAYATEVEREGLPLARYRTF